MYRLGQIALILATVLPLGIAKADFYTGNDLYARCNDNRAFALGYVTGLTDGASITEILDDQKIFSFCLPSKVTNSQLTDLVCKSLAENPKNRHNTVNWHVIDVLQTNFPCPKADKKP